MVSDIYTERKIELISIDDIDSLSKCDLKNLVIFGCNGDKILKLDVGRYCFHRNKKISNKNFAFVVNDSYSEINYKIVKKYLYDRLGNLSILSLIKYFSYLDFILKFHFENIKIINLNNYDQALKFYYLLTEKLKSHITQKKISEANASIIQLKCAEILVYLNDGLSLKYIQSICNKICNERKNKFNTMLKFSEDEHKKNYKLHEIIFNTTVDFVLERKKLPLIFNFSDIGLEEVVYLGLRKYDKNFHQLVFQNNYCLCDYKVFKNKINNLKLSDRKKANLRIRYNTLRKIIHNDYFDSFKSVVINTAVRSFYFMLASVTGGNTSSLLSLKIDSFEPIPSTKGQRAIVSKARANYKKVIIEFGVKFISSFKKFMKFRDFIFSEINRKDDLDLDLNLFFNITKGKFHNMDSGGLQNYRWWLRKYILVDKNIGKISWITTKEKRLNISNHYINQTNNLTLASIKLGNSLREIDESYLGIKLTDYQEKVSNFLTKYEESAIQRSRNTNDIIKTKFNKGKIDTLSGHCLYKEPVKIKEFNELTLNPSCFKSESCFFCESYSIHLDEDDLRKIYSIKYIYQYFRGVSEDESLMQIIYRINEIEEQILKKYPNYKVLINKIKSECEQGYLNEFWDLQFDTLLKLSS